MSRRTGLVVGKFCPLHRGHQALIDFALARCDHLILISYTNPAFEGCDAATRAGWLAALYPQATRLVVDDDILEALAAARHIPLRTVPHNDAPAEDHRAFCAWLCLVLAGVPADVVFTSEDYGDGFAASLTGHFANHRIGKAPVEHVLFDRERLRRPISGTVVRQAIWDHRQDLAEVVAASFVQRIAIIGGESSGKTTLAAALADAFGTLWVPEYGRELWEARDGHLVFADLLEIARTQVAREDAALRAAARYLFCDTTPLVTAHYSRAMFGQVAPELEILARRPYAHTLLCAPDFPFVQDGTRRDDAFRRFQHRGYGDALLAADAPHDLITGPHPERLAAAVQIIRAARHLTGS